MIVTVVVAAINECSRPEEDPLRHQCDQLCEDKADGYTCYCREGFQLNTDGKTCIGNILIYGHSPHIWTQYIHVPSHIQTLLSYTGHSPHIRTLPSYMDTPPIYAHSPYIRTLPSYTHTPLIYAHSPRIRTLPSYMHTPLIYAHSPRIRTLPSYMHTPLIEECCVGFYTTLFTSHKTQNCA